MSADKTRALREKINELQQELEQARVSAEDSEQQALTAVSEKEALNDELRQVHRRQHAAERAIEELRGRLAAVVGAQDAERATQGAAEEELQIMVEELEVLAEELQQANDQLRLINADLDTRVAARTLELERANDALRDRELRLSLAMRHAGACSWDWEPATGRVDGSSEVVELFGCEPMMSLADWLATVIPEDRAALQAALQQCADQCKAEVEIEYRILHPRRGLRWLSSRGRLFGDATTGAASVSGLSTDITDLKAAEELLRRDNDELTRRVNDAVKAKEQAREQLFQKQKLEALGQLAGGVAHDFNNLLAVIGNALHMSALADDAEQRRQLTARMQTAVDRGATLTQRLLSFGRRQTLQPQRLELRRCIDDVLEMLRPSLPSGIEIACSIEPGTRPVWVDGGELQLSLINLCVNARDAMPGGGRIEIQARNRDTGGHGDAAAMHDGFVEICVSDNGSGMSADVLARVFEPFFTTKDVGDGTGLGLAQVHGFVNQSGGTVYAASKPGEGTRITMLLPRAAPPVPSSRGASVAAPPEAPVASILMVEDDEDLGPLVEQMLQRRFRVKRVLTARAALESLQQADDAFDLLFTDIRLPADMNGLQLAQRVRQRCPQMPVVITTGYGGSLAAEAMAAGLPVVRKPYQFAELEAVLAGLCEKPVQVRTSQAC